MLEVSAPEGIGEITPGEDLAAILLDHASLRNGDVVVITSKVVSKAEGRLKVGSAVASVEAETERVVARRGALRIVRSRAGLTQATAGVDASNVPAGTHALLPLDPDASARTVRAAVWHRAGLNVGVLLSDTSGRAWRIGHTELAIGAAGVRLIDDYAGRNDGYGNRLAVTQTCLADEICAAAELTQGKLGRRPFAVVRGRADVVLPVGEDGVGATSLNRDPQDDLFGFGAREAVMRAILAQSEDASGFGAAASAEELTKLMNEVFDDVVVSANTTQNELVVIAAAQRRGLVVALGFAHGWQCVDARSGVDKSRELRLVRVCP